MQNNVSRLFFLQLHLQRGKKIICQIEFYVCDVFVDDGSSELVKTRPSIGRIEPNQAKMSLETPQNCKGKASASWELLGWEEKKPNVKRRVPPPQNSAEPLWFCRKVL